jgi:hypothetical protein
MAALTFATATTEVYDFGFADLNDSSTGTDRVRRCINEAQWELLEEIDHPLTRTTTSGTAPLTLTRPKAVLSVTDRTTDRILDSIDIRELEDRYPDLPDTGTPIYWYFSSENVVAVYPANTSDTILARYEQYPAEMSGTDALTVPQRFHGAVLHRAAAKLHMVKQNGEAALFHENEVQRILGIVAVSLNTRERDRTETIQSVSGDGNC